MKAVREYAGPLLRKTYSLFKAAEEGTSTAAALWVSVKPGRGAPYKIGVALVAATIEGGTTHEFSGPLLEENISGIERSEELVILPHISNLRHTLCLLTRWGYPTLSLPLDFFGNVLTYSALKALINDVIYNLDDPLLSISKTELLALGAYFLVFDLFFIIYGEMYRTEEEMRQRWKIPADQMWDKGFTEALQRLMSPLTGSSVFRNLVIYLGVWGEVIEHGLPLILSTPPVVIRSVIKALGVIPTVALSIPILGLGGRAIYVQSEYFEGAFVKRNMMAANPATPAHQDHDAGSRMTPWSAWLHEILMIWVMGPLEGIDSALPITLALREMNSPTWIWLPIGILFFLKMWYCAYNGEILPACKELRAQQQATPPSSGLADNLARFNSPVFSSRRNQDPELQSLGYDPETAYGSNL